MIVALIDNGSLEPAAHHNLRAVAAEISVRSGMTVHAVSWKHSDRIAAAKLAAPGDTPVPAWTLGPFVRAMVALGHREFVFVPFFISAQGAIGSALRTDLERLQHEHSAARTNAAFSFSFTDGLAARGVIPTIVAQRIREVIALRRLITPAVIVVDHGGPSPASAALRDQLAEEIRRELGGDIGPLAAASMEGAHPPLLADQLRAADFAGRETIIAPLFLSPGRHAGPDGDIDQICAESGSRWHAAKLVGTHPLAAETLAAALQPTLPALHAPTFA